MPPKVWLMYNPSIVVIDWHPQEILRCSEFTCVVDLDQWSKSTHDIFCHRCVALPLSPNISLSVSPSHLLALFRIIIYLYSFHIKTSWSACLIIIDYNKLSEDTTLCSWKIFSAKSNLHLWHHDSQHIDSIKAFYETLCMMTLSKRGFLWHSAKVTLSISDTRHEWHLPYVT
jgi:hypothetical protein